MSSDQLAARRQTWQFPAMGSFWTVYGIFRLIVLLVLVIYARTATLMFGALLSRVPDPFALMGFFNFLFTGMLVLTALSGIVGFVAGLALLGGHQSGRKLALIAAVLSVSDIPLGLTLGVYTLVALLPIHGAQSYTTSSPAAIFDETSREVKKSRAASA